MTFEELKIEAERADCESSTIDFKSLFDPNYKGDWPELIKDIVAVANSGGGAILFGLEDDGTPTNLDCTEILRCDPADITNKIYSYTRRHFADFRLSLVTRGSLQFGCLLIQSSRMPLVFESAGTYLSRQGKEKRAFAEGTVYFRHGAKSEPATSDDLASFLERQIAIVREGWLGRLRQVVEAPEGSAISIVPSEGVRLDEESGVTIRLTNDPSAPEYKLADPNLTHPYRQKEVLEKLKEAREELKSSVTSHHLQCIRRVHKVDANAVFCYHANYTSPTYSQMFVDWILERYDEDFDFFANCKSTWRNSDNG